MGIVERIRSFLSTDGTQTQHLAPRHERREEAREREHEGGEGWNEHDRHENEDGTRMVEDVTPRTPGSGGSRLA